MANGNTYESSDILGDNVKTASVLITTAQVLQLFTTPIQIIPAPATGYYLDAFRVLGQIYYNSIAYTTNLSLVVGIDTAGINLWTQTNLLTSTISRIISFTQVTIVTPVSSTMIIKEKGLFASVLTGNPAAGNSDIRLIVEYKILPFQ